MDLHLTVSGALTGDMFIAAILDAFPQYEDCVVEAIDAMDALHPVSCALLAHSEAGVEGRRFEIVPFERYFGHIPFAFSPERVTWDSLQECLHAAEIGRAVRARAAQLFRLIAAMPAGAPAVPATDAAQLQPWYLITQTIGAAALIEALGPVRWTLAGVPAGAAATPVAAAILDHLSPPDPRARGVPRMRELLRNGTGFGSPPAAGGYLRVLCFEQRNDASAGRDISGPLPMPPAGRTGPRPAQ